MLYKILFRFSHSVICYVLFDAYCLLGGGSQAGVRNALLPQIFRE